MNKPDPIATPEDCRALAEHEWEQMADDARALWAGGREQYVNVRATQHEKRFAVRSVVRVRNSPMSASSKSAISQSLKGEDK